MTEGVEYSWADFANRCKSLMLERGDILDGRYRYEDDRMSIEWWRGNPTGSHFEVIRRPADHEYLHDYAVVYVEQDGRRTYVDRQADLLYAYVIDRTEGIRPQLKKAAV